MDIRAETRRAAARKAVALLRSADFRSAIRQKGHSCTNVITLVSDDTVGYMSERLREFSGVATVLVDDGRGFTILTADPALAEAKGDPSGEILTLQPESSVALFIDYAKLHRGRPVTFSVVKRDEVVMELVDDDSLPCELVN